MKKLLPILLIIAICLIGIFYWVSRIEATQLVANKSGTEQVDDFILHIRIESVEDGIKVFRSIQYLGEESIELTHNTPLVSVSFINKNHDFTGSPVSKVLEKGNSYHPQNAATFDAPRKGNYELFCEASFRVNGEEIVINHKENLVFE